MNYGEKLKELREEKGLKIHDISRFLGFDKDTYGKYEREYSTIPIIHLITLCNYFNVSLDFIFGFSNIKQYQNVNKSSNLILSGNRLK